MRLGRETAKFIEEKAKGDDPFFAMLCFYSVHGPIQTTEERFKKFQAKAEKTGLTSRTEPRFLFDRTQEVRQVQDNPIYAGMMAAMDDAVGLVLDAIERGGAGDNTVVIFTSDNGGVSSGDSFSTSCLPMRGGKGRQWEGGIRQPYYIAWPGVTDKGGTTDALAIGMDFYPTILDIAGLPLLPEQHLDGISLAPALKGEPLPERTLCWHYPHYGNQGGEPSGILMTQDWKLIQYFENGRKELYRVNEDIGEQRDLARQHPEKVTEMSGALAAWQKEVGAEFPTSNPGYDPEKDQRALAKLAAEGNPKREQQHADYLKPDFVPPGGWWDQRKPGGKKGNR